ncbi:hypothetical protein N2F28_09170 [Leuconostoc falkenbergense]|jgi:hypothetical protein|uniref:Uncharacterized protein n=1 Tax=Leuconostoc falkenbergense TaxID=2766470 RepID=A0ABT7RZS1_9LACO|nr:MULTISPECIES: hypothetical protein [Leuconostoc]MDM7646392.1 hypothetical protein [Leuconostoc falkenbergense]MDV3546569.1 hypothetical protein [Leuconostoc falkenbergense]VTU60220.1 hypothetical protein AMBR_MGDJBKAP_01778 [Leuconostoc pseudomesenteroides]
MKTQIITGFWTAKSFVERLNGTLAELETDGHEIIEVQYTDSFFCYSALILYK